MVTPTGERFWLSNHHWEEVNTSLGELPELAINYKLRTVPDDHDVTVLDIGSGLRGVAMGELQERFAHVARKPLIAGVDLTNLSSAELPPNKLVADTAHLPFADETIDIAYSHQAISLIGDLSLDPKQREPLQPAMHEAVRVLRPGGVFIIDLDIAYDRDFTARRGLDRLQLPPQVYKLTGHIRVLGMKHLWVILFWRRLLKTIRRIAQMDSFMSWVYSRIKGSNSSHSTKLMC